MFISAIYGLSLAWFPFPIAYVVLRFLLDDLQHEYLNSEQILRLMNNIESTKQSAQGR